MNQQTERYLTKEEIHDKIPEDCHIHINGFVTQQDLDQLLSIIRECRERHSDPD